MVNSATPRIAVVIPAYNEEAHIIGALKSIKAQTRCPDEIIVVDDGSSDDTAALAQQWLMESATDNWKVLSGGNQGQGAARNKGICNTRADLIALLDADDRWLPHHLETLERGLDAHPDAVLAFGDAVRVSIENGKRLGTFLENAPLGAGKTARGNGGFRHIEGSAYITLVEGSYIPTAANLFSREAALDIGLFDDGFVAAEDRDFWLRLSRSGEFVYTRQILARHRRHEGNVTTVSQSVTLARDRLSVLLKMRNHANQLNLSEAEWRATNEAIYGQAYSVLYTASLDGCLSYLRHAGLLLQHKIWRPVLNPKHLGRALVGSYRNGGDGGRSQPAADGSQPTKKLDRPLWDVLIRGAAHGRRVLRARPWRPSHAAVLVRDASRWCGMRSDVSENTGGGALSEAIGWLRLAQDSQPDGGVAGRYSMERGWSSSYPETTGYLVPTFLRLADKTGDKEFEERAARCIRFLLGVQLSSGAFPGFEVADNWSEPSVFNTAQILRGLDAWHERTRGKEVLRAALRAANWLVESQDEDGAWREYTYSGGARTYYAHASCWLARFGHRIEEPGYMEAASAHLDWTLRNCDFETGWFERAGFGADFESSGAVTHTIGYTLFGVAENAIHLRRDDAWRAVRTAGVNLANRVLEWDSVPGVLGPSWKPIRSYTCPTGSAQLAQVWQRLQSQEDLAELSRAAQIALGEVRRAQVIRSFDPNLRGAIPGSSPIWGGYLPFTFPNWAVKFFIDAVLDEQSLLSS